MIILEKQLKGYIDMMIIHDSSMENITNTNNELYRLHNIRSSSSLTKNNGTMNSTSTMMPIMALRDQLGVINLRRRGTTSSSSSNEGTTLVDTKIISF